MTSIFRRLKPPSRSGEIYRMDLVAVWVIVVFLGLHLGKHQNAKGKTNINQLSMGSTITINWHIVEYLETLDGSVL